MVSIRQVFFLVLSGDCRVITGPYQIQFWGAEVACCRIGEVRGVVQVVQNLFTGIPNPSQSSRKENLVDLYQMSKDGVYPSNFLSCHFWGL